MKIPLNWLFHENPHLKSHGNSMKSPSKIPTVRPIPRFTQASQALLSASLLLRCDATAPLKSLARKDANGHMAARDAVGPPGLMDTSVYIYIY